MPDVKVVSVRLMALTDQYKKEMKASGDETKAFGATSTMALAAVGVAAFAFVKKSTDTYVTYGRSIMGLSRISGENIEVSSKMAFAAQRSGVSVEVLSNGIKFLEKNMASGNKKFDELGISVKDSNGKFRSAHTVFLETAEKIKGLATATERTDAILKIFGRSGLALGPMLMKGKAAIVELENEAQKYGMVLSKDNVAQISANVDAHRRLDLAMKGLQLRIGSEVLPQLTKMTEFFAGLPGPIMENLPAIAAVGASLYAVAIIGPKVVSTIQAIAASTTLMGAAMSGAALAGIAVILYGLKQVQDQSIETQKQLHDGIDFTNYAKTAQGINAEGDAVNRLNDEWNNMSVTERAANIGRLKIAQDATAQYEEDRKHYDDLTNRIKGLGTELGITAPKAQELADAMKIDLTTMDPAVYTPIFRGLAEGSISAAEATKMLGAAADEASQGADGHAKAMDAERLAAKALNDAEMALLNPQFAMLDATLKLTDAQTKATEARKKETEAQKKYNEAVLLYGDYGTTASDALKEWNKTKTDALKADQDLARANMDLDSAVRNLAVAFKVGDASIESTRSTLIGWVEQGRMTQDQADRVAASLGLAKIRADELNGTESTVTVVYKQIVLSPEQQDRRPTHEAELTRGTSRVSTARSAPVARASIGGGTSTTVIDARSYPSLNAPNYMGEERHLLNTFRDMLRDDQRNRN